MNRRDSPVPVPRNERRVTVLRVGPFRLDVSCAEPWMEGILSRRYGARVRSGRGDGEGGSLFLSIEASPRLSPCYSSSFRLEERDDGSRVTSSFMELFFRPGRHEGLLRIADCRERAVDSIENALRVSVQHVGAYTGRFLVHAACAGDGDRCILMPAPEGGGKSTLASRCARLGMDVYGDDLVMVSGAEGNGLVAWSLPFRGEAAVPFREGCALVSGILFLEKGRGARVECLSRAEAAAMFVSHVPYIGVIPPAGTERLLGTAAAAAGTDAAVFTYDLSSRPGRIVRRRLRRRPGGTA